jgi:peptidoglycan/LPS O-acetylase OafA/YrhL
MKNETRVFFKGINGLRFFAALAVIITHIELLKGSFGFKHYWKEPMVFNLGGLGVYFFFVLSGFLITYLLLKEKEEFGKITIKAFYIRRILRIWPLYYFVLVLGFFVLPFFIGIQIPYLQESFEKNYNINLLLYLFILPNLAFSLFPAVPHIGQLWSIGVEEQFYILWPLIIAKARSVSKTLFGIIAGLVFIKILVLVAGQWYAQEKWYRALKLFVAMSKFECMAIGGLGAYVLFREIQVILNFIYKRWMLWISVALIPVLIYFAPAMLQDGIHIVFSVLFLVIILNISNQSRFLEHPLLSYLGKISYGIYMYHFMIIPTVLFFFRKMDFRIGNFPLNVAIYLTVIAMTILVSGVSYKFFEKRFIRMKSGFSLVKSGEKD